MPRNRTKRGGKSENANAPAPWKLEKPRKIDRRVARTRDALGDALVALLQEKPFDSITVQQVLDRARVARSTFYTHFRGTNDLLLSDAEDFWEMMSSQLVRRKEKSDRVAPVRELFSHVAEWRGFYKAMVASEKVRDVMELGQGYFARSIAARLAELPAGRALSATRRAALGHAYAGAMFSLLIWWLSNRTPATAAQMDHEFHRIVRPGVGLAPSGGWTQPGRKGK